MRNIKHTCSQINH